MLAPDQMTPDTLRANLALYRAIELTQPASLDQADKDRYVALVQERQRRIAAQDTLEDGIYVSRAWEDEPHKSIAWRRMNATWTRITIAGEHTAEDREHVATPQTFYGIGWEKQIVRLVAVTA